LDTTETTDFLNSWLGLLLRLWLSEHGFHVRSTSLGINIEKESKAGPDPASKFRRGDFSNTGCP